jgi:hypothetical protein
MRSGLNSLINPQEWALENPNSKRRSLFRQGLSINVVVGIIDKSLTGIYVLTANSVCGILLAGFLEKTRFLSLEEVPINFHEACGWSTTSPHFHTESEISWTRVPVRISHVGLIVCPPLSHDLGPLRFLLKSFIKEKINSAEAWDRNLLSIRSS